MATKRCPYCKRTKSIEEFTANGKVYFGCNPCRERANRNSRKAYAKRGIKSYAQQKEYRRKLFAEPVSAGEQRCYHCLEPRPLSHFLAPELRGGRSKYCFTCREYRREYMAKRREKSPEYARLMNEKVKERNRKLKLECLDHYGHACACCGETIYEFLTFDHVNNDGTRHRAEVNSAAIAHWLIKHGFPDTIRVLCWNCQWGYRLCGVCPHRIGKQPLAACAN